MSRYPATVPEAVLRTAKREAGEYVFHLEAGETSVGCAELAEQARSGAARLLTLGVEPGDAVGVLGPNRPEWVRWAMATWMLGATLVPVQIPLRVRDPDAFGEQLRRLVAAARCRRVMADPRLTAMLPEGIGVDWTERGEQRAENLPPGPSATDPAVIQFTSGSTAMPKGAVLSHGAVMAQMELLAAGYHHRDGSPRATLSWTPFFHDLGLFANVVHPAVAGATSHHLPTERFARDPGEWLRLVERTRAALTVGPSSAFGSAVRAVARDRVDLSSLEVAFFAAEGVDPDVARRMIESAEPLGLAPSALGSTYGLAEAVMAVAYTPIGSGIQLDRVSVAELARSGVAAPSSGDGTRAMASCGPPRMEVRIAGAGGEELPERHAGEILVRGPSLMDGYVGDEAGDPFSDGWLRTGDLGYLAAGDLYLTGRAKDIVIAMGHNYHPEDFEWAAARHPAVKPGRCVAFSKPGSDEVVLLVEPSGPTDAARLASEIRAAVADAVGIAPREVLVLPAGAIEKTTSGKLRRGAMRDAYSGGGLSPLGSGAT